MALPRAIAVILMGEPFMDNRDFDAVLSLSGAFIRWFAWHLARKRRALQGAPDDQGQGGEPEPPAPPPGAP